MEKFYWGFKKHFHWFISQVKKISQYGLQTSFFLSISLILSMNKRKDVLKHIEYA